MNTLVRRVCRSSSIPLAFRRMVGRSFVPYSGREFALEVDGQPYTGHLDNYIDWVVYVTGQYYEYTYLGLIRSLALGGSALDIGANVGNHTTALAAMFERVLAVEPFTPVFRRLERKTALLPNVEVHNVGFGDAEAELAFSPPTGRNLGTGRVSAEGEITVSVLPGDTFLEGRGYQDLRFVKVDVEGHEPEVLAGLSGTLREHRPVVMYEAPRAPRGLRRALLQTTFQLLPKDYSFWGLRGQTTFPVQRSVARAVRIGTGGQGRRLTYVIACPEELDLPLP
jgi:FkbM family methyltransferase